MDNRTSLEKYYQNRPEFKLDETVSFKGIKKAIEKTFEYYIQNKSWNAELEHAKSVRICVENMIGLQTERQAALDSMLDTLPGIASNFFKRNHPIEDIVEVNLRVNGSSIPLEIRVRSEDNERAIYLKRFDIGRLLGIELYSLISGSSDYNYAFNSVMIIEEKGKGKHEFEYTEEELARIKDSDAYRVTRIKLDLIAFYMGVDDLGKKDNYLIAEDGRITIIDFDIIDRAYTSEDIRTSKEETCREIGISNACYEKIFLFQEFLLKNRIRDNREKINKLLDLSKEINHQNRVYAYLKTRFGDLE